MSDRAPEFWCPSCRTLVVPPNLISLKLIKASGACHACRLAKTVAHLVDTGQLVLLESILCFTAGYEGFRVCF